MIVHNWEEAVKIDEGYTVVPISSQVLDIMHVELENFVRKKLQSFEFSFQDTKIIQIELQNRKLQPFNERAIEEAFGQPDGAM